MIENKNAKSCENCGLTNGCCYDPQVLCDLWKPQPPKLVDAEAICNACNGTGEVVVSLDSVPNHKNKCIFCIGGKNKVKIDPAQLKGLFETDKRIMADVFERLSIKNNIFGGITYQNLLIARKEAMECPVTLKQGDK